MTRGRTIHLNLKQTDWLSVEYADATFSISVQALIEECVKFIMGKRAQDSLFIDEE